LGLYAARRLLAAIPLLLVTSFIVFSFLHLAPGSPEQVLLAGKNVNEATRQAIRDHYRLDDPFLTQYWTWLTNALQGDLGESIIFRDDVTDVVTPRILLRSSSLSTHSSSSRSSAWGSASRPGSSVTGPWTRRSRSSRSSARRSRRTSPEYF